MPIGATNLLSLKAQGALCTVLDLGPFAIMLDCGLPRELTIEPYQAHAPLLAKVRLVLISQASAAYSGALPFLLGLLHPSVKVVSTPVIFNLAPVNLHELLMLGGHPQYCPAYFPRLKQGFEGHMSLKPWQNKTIFDLGVKVGCCEAGCVLGGVYWRIWVGISSVLYVPFHNLYAQKTIKSMNLSWLKDRRIDLLITQPPAHPSASTPFSELLPAIRDCPTKVHIRVTPTEAALEVLAELSQFGDSVKSECTLNRNHFEMLKGHVEFMKEDLSPDFLKYWDACGPSAKSKVYIGSTLGSAKVDPADMVIELSDCERGFCPGHLIDLETLPARIEIEAPKKEQEVTKEEVEPQKPAEKRVELKPFLRFKPRIIHNLPHNELGEQVPEAFTVDQRAVLQTAFKKTVPIKPRSKKDISPADFSVKDGNKRAAGTKLVGCYLSPQKDCQMLSKFVRALHSLQIPFEPTQLLLDWQSARVHTEFEQSAAVCRVKGTIHLREEGESLQVHESEVLKNHARIEDLIRFSKKSMKVDSGVQLVYHPNALLLKGYYGEAFFQTREALHKFLKR